MGAGTQETVARPCRILSLDGGGAKGFYTLGVLKEIEAAIKKPLCEHFDLIFGTSTGAIIAALLVLGKRMDEIHTIYKEHVPTIMSHSTKNGRSNALASVAKKVFGEAKFSEAKTGVGIVATNWLLEKPMIFKSRVEQAHGRIDSFVEGFGCTFADAVTASCSAYPYFRRVVVTTAQGEDIELFDGGYCANSPTLYAIADAISAMKKTHQDLRVLSVGVGMYPKPDNWMNLKYLYEQCLKFLVGFTGLLLLQKTLDVNTASMEQLREVLFKDILTVRINDRYEQPEMATDLLESDPKKLNTLFQQGRESFARYETHIRNLLDLPVAKRL